MCASDHPSGAVTQDDSILALNPLTDHAVGVIRRVTSPQSSIAHLYHISLLEPAICPDTSGDPVSQDGHSWLGPNLGQSPDVIRAAVADRRSHRFAVAEHSPGRTLERRHPTLITTLRDRETDGWLLTRIAACSPSRFCGTDSARTPLMASSINCRTRRLRPRSDNDPSILSPRSTTARLTKLGSATPAPHLTTTDLSPRRSTDILSESHLEGRRAVPALATITERKAPCC